MHVTDWILAAVALLGLIAAVSRWFFARGAEERELTIAVRENTTVTKELSKGLASLKDFTTERVHELVLGQEKLDHRVSMLEGKGKTNA